MKKIALALGVLGLVTCTAHAQRTFDRAQKKMIEGTTSAGVEGEAPDRTEQTRKLPSAGGDAAGTPLPMDDSAGAPLPLEDTAGDDSAALDAVPVPPFFGTPRQGLAEIRRLARDGDALGAAVLAGALVDRVDARDEQLLAELRYAGGVAYVIAQEHEGAADAFRSASSFTVGPELRRDSVYNEAAARIAEGEEYRANIMEVALKEQDFGGVGSTSPEDLGLGPDTLPDARVSYQEARRLLLDRIRMDWRDADARANLEFTQVRLDELAEIESRRSNAASEDSKNEGMETEKTEEGDGSKGGEEESEEQQEESGQHGNDPDSDEESVQDAETSPGEGADEGDDMPDPNAEEREGEEQQKQEQADSGQENEQLESEQGGAEADQEMSKQEARMILDRLNELDEKAKRLRAALMKTRMIEVARDW